MRLTLLAPDWSEARVAIGRAGADEDPGLGRILQECRLHQGSIYCKQAYFQVCGSPQYFPRLLRISCPDSRLVPSPTLLALRVSVNNMSTGRQLRVLVVGASIAGPATAHWLAKAGAHVTAIERFPRIRQNGQNVDIRTVGVTAMRKIPGMEATVRAKTVPIDGFSFVSSTGQPFATIRKTGDPDRQSLVSEYEIYRGDLSKILFDLTNNNPNIHYIFNTQISSIHPQPSADNNDNTPLTVHFTSPHPHPPPQSQTFDLIVACDGATSRTRALAFPNAHSHTQPVNSWVAYFTLPPGALLSSNTTTTTNTITGQSYSAPGGRFSAIGHDPASGQHRVVLMGMYPRSNTTAMVPFRAAAAAQKQGNDDEQAGIKGFIAREFTGAGWRCDEIVQGMMQLGEEEDNFYAAEVVQVKMPCWSSGRVVLVGDAGYAPGPTGAGTSLALAGAYVLAGEVGRHIKEGGGLEVALKRYEAVMRPVVGELQQVPWGVQAVLAPQTRWGLAVRNAVLWFVFRTGVVGLVQRVFGGVFKGREETALPEYEWLTDDE